MEKEEKSHDNNQQSQTNSSITESHLAKLKSIGPQYQQKYLNLFFDTITKKTSEIHFKNLIIINPKNIFNLLQSNHLNKQKKQSKNVYYKNKAIILTIINNLFQEFKLNAKFIKQNSKLTISNNKNISFVQYLVKEIYSTFESQQVQNKEGQSIKVDLDEQSLNQYRMALKKIYEQIVRRNTLKIFELQCITQNLSKFYYLNKLTPQIIQTSFRLIEAGIQQRSIYPHLYFIQNSQVNAIRVLFNNVKWMFSKGMTVWLWFTQLSSTEHECTILSLKTDQHNFALKIKKQNKLCLCFKSKEGQQIVQICILKRNQLTLMGIQLDVIQGGFLKSNSYALNIKVNNHLYKNVSQKIPKFASSQLLSQFNLFDRFIGAVYSIIIQNKPQLSAYEKISTFSAYGVCNQKYVWSLIDSNILKKETILCVFNAERFFQGVLINYVGQKNVACFSGLISKDKYNKYDYKIIDVVLPYLYFLVLTKKQQNQTQQKYNEFSALFDLIIKQIIEITSDQELIPNQDILFILYFLQIGRYSITQATLNYFLDQVHSLDNFYLKIVAKYIDVPLLLQKGLKLQNFDAYDFDPVQKIQILFYLQTKWKQKWNEVQGFQKWWSPFFFNYQKNSKFNIQEYTYDPHREQRVEWQVKNFITNDYCKCILQPQFKIPQLFKALTERYSKQYVNKQCFQEEFKVNLSYLVKNSPKILLKKYGASSLDKMKKKLLGQKVEKKQLQISQQSTLKQFKPIKSQFFTECLNINLLTVILGTLTLTTDGFIIFSIKHNTKTFDHMCVKAFANQQFIYFSYHYSQIRYLRKKRFNQSNNTIQIRKKNGQTHLLYLYLKDIDKFIQLLQDVLPVKKDPYQYYLQSEKPIKWIEKSMSNYQYIQWLNQAAGRNYLDITQYPVLPWAFVADSQTQKKEELVFRKLTKNMGSHGTQERIRHFMQKYSSYNQSQLFNQYHFGTHYSSSAIIFNYLIRLRPYSIGALTLQSGKFDCADRVFWSYVGSWINATTSPTDIRELIPQIYILPQMLININNYDFGLTQTKQRIDNVQIPKWANKNPYEFVSRLRKQLQSPYVSENINNWIDLIFGFKQRGNEAVNQMNIFFPLTYEYAIDLDKITEVQEKISYETQIAHFGQNPNQIIGNNPHPLKMKIKSHWQDKLISDGNEISIQRCNLQKLKDQKDQKFLYNSVFQGRNSVLCIKFLNQTHFIVIRKHQYIVFKILSKKSDFISKQQEVLYQLQTTQISLNYKQLQNSVPAVSINQNIVAIGGFYNGYLHFIFVEESKCNQAVKFSLNTITAIAYDKIYKMLYLGDSEGYLKVYQIISTTKDKQIEFFQVKSMKIHDSKINHISHNGKANLFATCSFDGYVKLFNLYSHELIRVYENPDLHPVHFCQISRSPLYSVIFYSAQNSKIYSYSINGQFLQQISQKVSFLYNMQVLHSSDTTQTLVYLNSLRQIYVNELPFLKQKRKIKLKKDQFKISCFQCCQNSKICIVGTEDGGLQIVANPSSYSQ